MRFEWMPNALGFVGQLLVDQLLELKVVGLSFKTHDQLFERFFFLLHKLRHADPFRVLVKQVFDHLPPFSAM